MPESSKLPTYMWNFMSDAEEGVQDTTTDEHCRPSAWGDDLGGLEEQEKDESSMLLRFSEMSGKKQMSFLRRKVLEFMPYNSGNTWKEKVKNWTNEFATSNTKRGEWAKTLRGLVKNMKLNYLFSFKRPYHRQFMNENLREFLNLNDIGTMYYSWDEVHGGGWREEPSLGAAYHQYEIDKRDGYHNNAKFLHEDGREVIFNDDEERVNTDIDRGTFNYAPVKESPKYLIFKALDYCSVRKSLYSCPVYKVLDIYPISKLFDTCPIYERHISHDTCPIYKLLTTHPEHDLYDVIPWLELMRREYPKYFGLGKNAKDPRQNEFLWPFFLLKNSTIWRIPWRNLRWPN